MDNKLVKRYKMYNRITLFLNVILSLTVIEMIGVEELGKSLLYAVVLAIGFKIIFEILFVLYKKFLFKADSSE